MGLVGSLEDLSLTDVLQILGLSRKTGLLMLRSQHGDAALWFRDGRVLGAARKGGPADLRELVVRGGLLPAADVDRRVADAHARGISLEDALAEDVSDIDGHLERLRGAEIEQVVLMLFGWHSGEFSFEPGETPPDHVSSLLLRNGITGEYLAMEGARRHDELMQSNGSSSSRSAPNADASDELQFSGDENTDAAGIEAQEPAPVPDETTARVAAVAVDRIAERAVEQASPLPRVAIVIEPELPALDWLRETLAPAFSRIHAFQRSEQGVERLRQYLARGDVPAVLVSDRALADPASGALDALSLLERVRSLSPRAFTALVVDPDSTRPAPRGVDVRLVRPRDSDLVGGLSRGTRREQAARRLQDDLLHGASDEA